MPLPISWRGHTNNIFFYFNQTNEDIFSGCSSITNSLYSQSGDRADEVSVRVLTYPGTLSK